MADSVALGARQFERDLWAHQQEITQALTEIDGQEFLVDVWQKPENARGLVGNGQTMVLKQGAVFEQAGVNVSVVRGQALPPSATVRRPELAGCGFEAMGLSLVIHPRNPYVPTSHANVRLFVVKNAQGVQDWWFGGGFDLTPFYVFEEDGRFWHEVAAAVCVPFGAGLYAQFKKACDEYFYLPHRQETRGIGGLFFDDFNALPFAQCRELANAVARGFLTGYVPIVKRRMGCVYGAREREFQLYRRGRYVEFNLVYDRGTHFGLQSGGRVESILMSLPPNVRFEYDYIPEAGSAEAMLQEYLQPRDWGVV